MSVAHTYDILERVVKETKCFPHWRFRIEYEGNPRDLVCRLVIFVNGTNNYDPTQHFPVNHYHPVPITTYNETSWRQFVYDCCIKTLQHEVGESLRFGTDEKPIRPFAPMHGPGEDPYARYFIRSVEDALTTQDGSKREGPV